MYTDIELIDKIKKDQDDAAIVELINRHTGIYFSVVQKYSATYPTVCKYDELKDDKMYNIYRFVLDYKPDKGTKVSSYIHDRTDYLCRSLLKDDTRPYQIPSRQKDYLDAIPENGAVTILPDETESAKVEVVADKDLCLEDIVTDAAQVKDKRFMMILKARHFTTPVLTWRQLGQNLGISHERVRQIYQENIEKVKRHLQESHS